MIPIIAVFAYFIVVHETNQNKQLFLGDLLSSFSLSRGRHHHDHHSHKKRPDDSSSSDISDICDDFPPGIPPPNTNTTTYLCVDRRGCCNFTTVQAAVNAVPDFSDKRNIVWINSVLISKVFFLITLSLLVLYN